MYYYERLRDLREDADLTQKEAGAILNTTHHLLRLAEYYHVSMDYITGRADWEDTQILNLLQTWSTEQKKQFLQKNSKK